MGFLDKVTAITKAVHIQEIPDVYKDLPVIARGNTSIILEKDPKTVIMLTRDAMKKDWLIGISIANDFKVHDVHAKNRAFKDISLYALEMPKLYKPDNTNQAKIRKEMAFFENAQNHVGGVFKAKQNLDKMMYFYEQNGMEQSLVYRVLDFLTNYYHDQWNWDIARRQFVQDADGNLILLDPIVSAEVAKIMHGRV